MIIIPDLKIIVILVPRTGAINYMHPTTKAEVDRWIEVIKFIDLTKVYWRVKA